MSNFNFNEADIEYMSGVLGTGFLKRFSPADCLSALSVEEVVRHFKVEDIWASLSREEKTLLELALADKE